MVHRAYKSSYVLQVSWWESLHPWHFVLQILTEIFVKSRAISISILLSFNVSSQLLIEVQQVAIGGKERIYDDMNETSTKPYWLRIWGLY